MNKKVLPCLIIASLIIVIFLSACGTVKEDSKKDTGATTAQSSSETTKPVESQANQLKADLSMWIYPMFEKVDQFFNDKVLAEINKTNPGIKVTTETIPWDGGPVKVNVAIASGSTPDILCDGPLRINGYASKGSMVELDDVIDTIKDKYFATALDSGLVNGKRYIIPTSSSAAYTLTVNSTLAKELGVYDMLPKDYMSWTLEDFSKFITAATEKGKSKGIYGTALWAASQSSDAAYFSFLMSAGAKVFNDEKKQIVLNSPEAVKGLDILTGLVKNKLVVPGAPTLKDEDSNTLFFNKKIVVEMTSGLWNVSQVEEQKKAGTIKAPFDVELYEFPSFDGKSPKKAGFKGSGIAIFVNQNDENKIKAAKEFSKEFVLNSTLLNEYIVSSGQISVQPGVTVYADDPIMNKEAMKCAEWSAKNGDPEWGALKPYWSEIRTFFYPEIQAAYSGVKTSQQALDEFVQKANEVVTKNEN